MKINVTRRSDGQIVTKDAYKIDYIKPSLFECEIFFIDGSSIRVSETEKQITQLIKAAEKLEGNDPSTHRT